MRYHLEPNNRGVNDDDMLTDLRRVADVVAPKRLTSVLYGKHGRFHPTTVINRFHGWNKALAKAGLALSKVNTVDICEAIDDLSRVAKLLGVTTLTQKEYGAHGRFSPITIAHRCGGWLRALSQAGLAPSRNYRITDEQLFQNIATVWDHLGRQPTYGNMTSSMSSYSPGGYEARFGSWRKALEAFVAFMETDSENEPACEPAPVPATAKPERAQRRTPRTVGWKLRFLVLQRDHFRCRACGLPGSEANGILEADHVIPWAKGGETKLENLQTLCKRCNGGKSNLDWEP